MENDKDAFSQKTEATEQLVGLVKGGVSIAETSEVMAKLRRQSVKEETGENGAIRIEYSDGSAVIRNDGGIALGVHRDRIQEAFDHQRQFWKPQSWTTKELVRFWKAGNYPAKLKFAYPHAPSP